MKPPHVLVVEDEIDIRELMLVHLKREGIQVTSVDNGEDALKLLKREKFDLAILDWMLPGVSGLEICKQFRDTLPILMVTARADTADIVLGLEMGADDYVTKPFEIPVFLARTRALLRRASQGSQPASGPGSVLKVGGLTLDAEKHEARCGNEELQLTPSEFKLLSALMSHSGRVLTRNKLIELVQGEGVVVVDRAIDTHIFGLRKKLGSCADTVETIRGVGYRVQDKA
jgi:two-component system phosphate regulon response regulator PhoB